MSPAAAAGAESGGPLLASVCLHPASARKASICRNLESFPSACSSKRPLEAAASPRRDKQSEDLQKRSVGHQCS